MDRQMCSTSWSPFFLETSVAQKRKRKKREKSFKEKGEKEKKTVLNCPLQLLFCDPNWELAISFFFFFSIHHFWLFFHHQSLWLHVQKHLYDEMSWNLRFNVKKVTTFNCTWTSFVSCTIILYLKREMGTIALWPHAKACWMRVEREWKRVGLIDGWCGSECHGVVINNCQWLPMNLSLMCEEQSCVYQSRCVLASSINFMVLTCAVRCRHCSRHSESGMALGMMSLQSSHLTHAW